MMKKIFPYILIVLIFVQFLAPFTIGSDEKKNLEIKSSKVEAADGIKVTAYASKTDTNIKVNVRVVWFNEGWRTTGEGVVVTLLDQSQPAKVLEFKKVDLVDVDRAYWLPSEIGANAVQVTDPESETIFTNLSQQTTYGINTVASQAIFSWWDILLSGPLNLPTPDINTTTTASPDPLLVTTEVAGATDYVQGGEQVAMNDETLLPICDLMTASTWGGCIGRVLYWAIFKPTSYIFALTGRLLDISVDYSTKDTSYRSSFVVEGWGVVRDFCNMFFIFILLYIAFGTILNLHSVKTKEMIINVVIIGLLINFSLFATHVIIDASNILTRVFYNSQTITVGPMDNGIIQNQVGSQGEIQLSLALVGKINPQRLILDAGKADNISIKKNVGDDETSSNGISATTFILVTILASVVNIVGIIVFLASSLIFIARVIGLWIAMIFAPLAFMTYTVPATQGWEMVGWKKWWPETLKLAFLAPIFVFFMYLIIKFLETGLGLNINDDKGGLDFVLGIFVPFIFIMILLTKAKDIAKTMSGKIGQSITDGLAKVGGFALGAGVGGLAMAGRASIGRLANKANTSGWLNDAASGKKGRLAQTFGTLGKNMTDFTSKSSFDLRQSKAGNAFSKETGMNLNENTNILGLDTKKGLGGYAGEQQRKLERQNKFAKSLGFDHHKYEEVKDEIGAMEGELAKYKANVKIDHNSKEYKAMVAKQEFDIANKKKDLERVESSREKEYALAMKKKSGMIYKHVETDSYGNIKKFGHAEKSGAQAAKQIMKEFAKGMAQGAGAGALAGSVVPGIGTLGGAIGGGLIGAVRSTMKYSGTTNRKVGDASHGDKHDVKDKYVPPAPTAHSSNDSHDGGGHDDHGHGGDDHGGGGHGGH